MAIGASTATKLALIVPVVMLAGCATASRPASPGVQSASARAGQACTEIMGLRPGAEHVACVGRLSHYAEALDAAFADSEPQQVSRASQPAMALSASLPSKYYLHMNSREQLERAQLSCAGMGLPPGWASFGHCVHSLNYAIADAKNWPGP